MNIRYCFGLLLLCALLAGPAPAFAQQNSFKAVVSGKGQQAAILIPGFSCSGSIWDATVKQLSDRYTCHVLTFAGFAGVPAQTDPHFREWEGEIATYIREKHLAKPVIIGHSIGGVMAMMLATDYPDLVSRIVVVDALPCLFASRDTSFKAAPGKDCSPMVSRFTSMSDSALRAQQSATAPMLSADTATQRRMVEWAMQSDRKTLGQIYCEFVNIDLRNTIAAIQCPAFIMLEASFKMYPATIEAQFAKLPHKQVVYAGKGLHFIMTDDRDWYAAQLKIFLLQ